MSTYGDGYGEGESMLNNIEDPAPAIHLPWGSGPIVRNDHAEAPSPLTSQEKRLLGVLNELATNSTNDMRRRRADGARHYRMSTHATFGA